MIDKKIAVLIINCIQGGGAERSVLTLGQGFYELGFDVHIVRFKPLVEYDLNPNLHYHLVKFRPFKLIPGNVTRHRLFSKVVDRYILQNIAQPDIVLSNLERPDRVMCHSQLDNVLHVIRNTVSKEFGIDLISKQPKSVIKELKDIYRHHPCVCVSKGVENDMNALFGDSVTTTTIYNAFDKPLIESMGNESIDDSLPEEVQKLINSGDYIINVGSFKPQKAHEVLLGAYAKSTRNYPLVLVGQGKQMEQMKGLAKELGIAERVYFLGFHKNPYPFIKHAKLFVLSSRFEGFVRVVAEAQALNVPVISTDCPSGPSELLPSENLVPVDDIEALANKISDAMARPEHYRVSFDEKYLPSNIANQYVDYLASLNTSH